MQAISLRTCAIIGVVGLLLGGCRETEKRVPTGPGGPLFGTIGTPNKQDWKQCQNNKNNPDDVCNWVTGNLDASHNVYHEGDFVPHALRIGGVQNTDAFSVVMTYGFLKGGKTSHDFLGVWNQTMHNANPCVDGSYTMFCSAGSPGTLTGPFVTSNSMATLVQNAVNAACGATSQYALDMAHAISAVGADKLVYTGQNVSDITVNSIAFDGCPASGDAEATVTLTVKPTITAVVAGKTDTGLLLLVASHVARTWFSASVGDWHNGGAFDISGSPYHLGLLTVDGKSSGSMDLQMAAQAIVVLGDLYWEKHAGSATGALLGGATFNVCLTGGSCVSVTDNSPPDTDPTAGKFHMTGLALGTYTITETAAPAGYNVDPTPQSVTLTFTLPTNIATPLVFVNYQPGAKISIAQTATNGITVPHTFTVTVQKDPEGDGTFVAAAGVTVTLTLTAAGGASLQDVTNACSTGPTDSSGQCTATFTSPTAGTVTGHATASVTIGAVTVSLATDGTGNNSGDAVKTYVAGTLKWLKNDQAGQPLAGATFSYCLGAQTSCPTVTDNSTPDADAAAGKFQINGLVLGTYTICETVAPAGYTKDPNCQNVTLTTGATVGTATNAFVNLKPSAKISIATAATNGITVPHTFTVTLQKDPEGDGTFVAANGEHVDVTLTNGGGASYVLDAAASTCDDAGPNTDSNGQCTMKFSSATAGTVTGHATANLTVGGVALSVATDGTGNNSGDAVKTYVAGTLKWLKNDQAGQPLAGATFSYCLGADCHNVTDNSAPDADADAGKFQINGLVLGTYQICETAAPAGYTKDPNCQNVTLTTGATVGTATNAFVNLKPSAKISIATAATNGITVPHTFTVTLQKDPEGDGTFVAASGEHVDVTLTNGGGASYVLNAASSTCDDAGANTDVNGQCTMVFTSATAGTVTGHATASLTVGGVLLSVATDGTGNNSGDAVKTYVAGTLKWLKNDQAGQPLAGATFSYCLGADCHNVTDNSAPDADAAAGKFQINGLVLGTYQICETAAPAGYTKDPNCQNVTLTTGAPEGSATNAFVNLKPSAKISIAADATNGITVPHTFTVTLMKNLGNGGGWQVASGEHVDVTLTNGSGASYVLDGAASTCDDAGPNTDSNGQCTMKFSSATAGTVTGHATANLTVGGVALSVATDGTGGNSGDAVKTYVAGTLKWLKNDEAGQPLAGATFSYCLGADCHNVTDNSAPDANAAAGKFQINGLVLGTYQICETAAPAGYTKDPNCQNVTLTVTDSVVSATNPFVNLKPSAKISIATTATNGITVPHTFTVTLQKDPEGDGTFVAANGEHVDVTLTNGSGASYVLDAAASTCDDAGPNTDSNGQCTMKFSSATAGTVTGHATSSLTVGGVALSVATDGTGNNSGDAVKTYVAGTLKWLKNDQAGQALAGATFSYCLGAQTSCPTVTDNSTPDANAADGKFQINGLVLGTYTICETAAPAGYTKDPTCQNVTLTVTDSVVSATNAFVNPKPSAAITIASAATNGITVPHTFTVTLTKDPGDGSGSVAASGEHVDVTLTNAGGASYVLDAASSTCDDAGANTDSNGQCTMKFSSATAGTVTGHATASLTVGGVALSVATDGTGNNSGDAVKTYVAGTLKWLKNDQAGQALAGATFSYCLGAQTSCPTVTDNSTPDADAAAGKFQINGLVLGTYTICETAAPAGYAKDPTCQQVTLTTGSPVGQATNAFVNTPTTRSGIYPTQTTCQDFSAGTATILSTLSAGLKGNNINNVSPGVFFYYASVIPVTATDQIAVAQSNTQGLNNFLVQQGQAYLYDATCNRLPFTLTLSSDGTQVIDGGLSGLTPGATYYVGIKYDPSSVVGQQVRYNGVVTKLPDPYTYVMTQNGGASFNSATITLVQK